MISEKKSFSRDIRFWLLIVAVTLLFWITVSHYPGIA